MKTPNLNWAKGLNTINTIRATPQVVTVPNVPAQSVPLNVQTSNVATAQSISVATSNPKTK